MYDIFKIVSWRDFPAFCAKVSFDFTGIAPEALREKSDLNSLRYRGEHAGYWTEKDKLILYRDRLGGRGMYYTVTADAFIFGTDLRRVAKAAGAASSKQFIDTEYLPLQFANSEATFYYNVYRVLPAHYLEVTPDKQLRSVRYWRCSEAPRRDTSSHDILGIINDACAFRKRVVTEWEASYCGYLSGGLDSSTVCSVVRPQRVFTGYYDEPGYDEREYAHAIELPPEGQRVDVEIESEEFVPMLDYVQHVLQEPCCGVGVIPQTIVASLARMMGHTYAFTGEGGDEVFCGYAWNMIFQRVAEAAEASYGNPFLAAFHPLLDKVCKNDLAAFVGALLCRDPRRLADAVDCVKLHWDSELTPLENMHRINIEVALPAILSVDEWVGRYAGVEPVSPLCDYRLVEAVWGLGPARFTEAPKQVLRDAIKGIVPEKVRGRTNKMGFPIPAKAWGSREHMNREEWARHCISKCLSEEH